MNRYYMAAQHISYAVSKGQNVAHMLPTLDDAIEKAKLEIAKGNTECVAIVKIVAVVRRQTPPVDVEYLRD